MKYKPLAEARGTPILRRAGAQDQGEIVQLAQT